MSSRNPLAVVGEGGSLAKAPTDKQERQRHWIERGNRILWGQESTSKGDYLDPRPDLEWICRNDSYFIEPRRSSAGGK
jgi:hypothetical protein